MTNASTKAIDEKIGVLRARLKKLEDDSSTIKLTLDNHCAEVRRKIDLHTETLIAAIEHHRAQLIDQVDLYQTKLFENLHTSVGKARVKATIDETHQLLATTINRVKTASNDNSGLEINPIVAQIEQQLDKVVKERDRLRSEMFGGVCLDFEPVQINHKKLVGENFTYPVKCEDVFSSKRSEKGLGVFKFKLDDLPAIDYCNKELPVTLENTVVASQFVLLPNETFLSVRICINKDLLLTQWSSDLKLIKNSKRFEKFFSKKNITQNENFGNYHTHNGVVAKRMLHILKKHKSLCLN
jgi:hypothetical protein